MNTVETVLVIVLSVGFLTLIILSIILISLMIAIMKNVRRISKRAEEATGNIADIASMIGTKVVPVAVSTLVAAIVRRFKNKKK